ncbi:unnamed protein product [Microthlaspi erraticum]|uniref:F-box domain-containing protein n=1 Tax=Microthlaspi erraticum TaxID=1685480 RepID=A0A6D2I5V3_9BRAS|nr:unnamed protein product [Microthlaspi erraticum]
MMPELPGDLVEDILSRVPATSLERLRSTCKPWDRLFNDKRFTRKHFDKAPKQFMFILLKNRMVCSMSINLHKVQPQKVTDEVSLTDLHSSLDQIMDYDDCRVFHCDGLLLCINREFNDRLVVWNPCTGQTRWIDAYNKYATYALGSYQDKTCGNSYKILGYSLNDRFGIFELNSNSWRFLDFTLDFHLPPLHEGVSLKGKTYWIVTNGKKFDTWSADVEFLITFDYTTERFERLLYLPRLIPYCQALSLSVVREEKLAVLLKYHETEIWVADKIGETKAASSWRKLLVVDFNNPSIYLCKGGSFLVDEEKKVLVCCDYSNTICIAGKNNNVRKLNCLRDVSTWHPFLFNYVPSLTQI